MAQESENKGSSLSGNGFIWLAVLLVGSAIVHEKPFELSRPKAAAPALHQHADDQDVEARLWQDPYAAVATAMHAEEKSRGSLSAPAEAKPDHPGGASLPGHDKLEWNTASGVCRAETTRVLMAMVSGGPYPGNAESRRRTRFAVLSALTASDYIPVDEEHIGYLNTQSAINRALPAANLASDPAASPKGLHSGRGQVTAEQMAGLPAVIPWERFTRAQSALDRFPGGPAKAGNVGVDGGCVLVLWLDEDGLIQHPLPQLAALQTLLDNTWRDLSPASGEAADSPQAAGSGHVPLTLIGPAGSRVLEAIVRDEICNLAAKRHATATPAATDAKRDKSRDTEKCVDSNQSQYLSSEQEDHPLDLKLYSFSASVPDRVLVRFAADLTGLDKKSLKAVGAGFDSTEPLTAQVRTPSVREILGRAGIDFRSFILDDDVVIRALGCELQRRHVQVACTGGSQVAVDGMADAEHAPSPLVGRSDQVSHVVVVSELDTLYGRTLPEEVGRGLGLEPVRELARPDCDKATLQGFGYLRGLDGQLPARADEGDEGAPKGSAQGTGGGAKESQGLDPYVRRGALERAEGQSQFDYLRRLADRIKGQDEWLRTRCSKAHVDAIGILGSDVYDKLLVLQALRPRFPDALFFTTDLDARFQHPDVIEWTRNLLVTSSLGLSLGDSWQGGVPPFRDSYQTSAFLATRLAINDCPARFPCQTSMPSTNLLIGSPLVYEIGRNSTFGFDPYARPPLDGSAAVFHHPAPGYWKCTACQMPDELVPRLAALPGLIGFLVPEVLVVVALWRSLPGVRKYLRWRLRHTLRRREGRVLVWTVVALCLAIPAFAFAGLSDALGQVLTEYGQGEPMRLADGISAWPTLLLRCLNALLCLYFLMQGAAQQRQNLRSINMALKLGKTPAWVLAGCAELQRLGSRLDSFLALFSARPLLALAKKQISAQGGGKEVAPDADANARAIALKRELRYNALNLWRVYVWQGRFKARIARAGAGVAFLLIIGLAAMQFFGHMVDPLGRGDLIPRLNLAVTLVAVFAMQFLVLYVADSLLFCARLIQDLCRQRAVWPESTLDQFARKFNLDPMYLEDWIDIRFIEMRTLCLTRQIYFPFLAVGIMVFARNPLFDRWPLNPAILAMQLLSGSIVLFAALRLRWTAEVARELAVARIRQKQVALRASTETSATAEQLEILVQQIETTRQGAFAPFSHQPIVRALLLPVGGFGGAELLARLIDMAH